MVVSASALKSNITKLKSKIVDIDRDEIICIQALNDLYGLVERLNNLDADILKEQEIILAQGFANRFITKTNRNKLSANELSNLGLLKDILMATYIIKITYQNIVEPSFRTEAELTHLSEDIDNLKRQKNEYEDLLKKADRLLALESVIVHAEDTIEKISEISSEVESYNSKISSHSQEVEDIIDKISNNKNLSDKYIAEINATNEKIDAQIELIEQNERKYRETFNDLNLFINDTKNQFQEQKNEIQKIIEDANRASMAGSFQKRKTEITNSIRFLDLCTFVFLGAIVCILWYIFSSSYNQEIFSPTLFFSRTPITLPLIWLAWLASRRSTYLTRIREDYAYKYSSAMAFEGYKKQVQEISPELQEKLLEIAVNNLGDNPTRLYKDKIKHTPIDLEYFLDLIKSLPKEKIEELLKLISNWKK
ncbi:hypothetical protein GA0061081_102216 [Gilliamella bombicola]|uniref:Uncharacterized protein n=1 Tax=Gilliamella bombicola TaxID=1798182 RepID=A0A1C4A330_9GAMM|nr:hypothetical protein [Gilliamella bombicola]SCB88971.1 hypothetical protein GA0061081_102216 [Gilliamella bombicola]